jgi:aldose 1-epimerase
MAVEKKHWASLDGREIRLFVLKNPRGSSLVLTDFGAAAVQMNMPSPSGEIADVILGFDSAAEYRETPTYFGATVGRFGNRIRGGRFVLDGVGYQTSTNEGANHLHGGGKGFDKKIRNADFDPKGNSVSFGLVSPDGDEMRVFPERSG